MSDYEITLINDSMQEFYVRFHGPQESEYSRDIHSNCSSAIGCISRLRKPDC